MRAFLAALRHASLPAELAAPRTSSRPSLAEMTLVLHDRALERFDYHCGYCRTPVDLGSSVLDFVLPKATHGIDLDNQVPACMACSSLREFQSAFDLFVAHSEYAAAARDYAPASANNLRWVASDAWTHLTRRPRSEELVADVVDNASVDAVEEPAGV